MIINVVSGRERHCFTAIVHTSNSTAQLHLDPEDFYKRFGEVPQGMHHELELVEPNATLLSQQRLHIHPSRNGERPFICYPKQVPTIQSALEIFGVWCLGTVLVIVKHIDLNTVLTNDCGNDLSRFPGVVQERYGIRLV